MNLIKMLMTQYGLSEDEAKTFARGIGLVQEDPKAKALNELIAADAKYGMLVGLQPQRDKAMGNRSQGDVVAERGRMMGGGPSDKVLSHRDAIVNSKEIQMPAQNARDTVPDQLRYLADMKMQYGPQLARPGYEGNEIQMPADNSARDLRIQRTLKGY